MRLFSVAWLAFALLGGGAAPAWAHALLRKSLPAVGATVKVAPDTLSLSFSESVEPRFCRVQVRDAHGADMPVGDLHGAPGDASQIVLGLPKLPPGVYRVEWHAVSVDTHRTEGRFSFTVAP